MARCHVVNTIPICCGSATARIGGAKWSIALPTAAFANPRGALTANDPATLQALVAQAGVLSDTHRSLAFGTGFW